MAILKVCKELIRAFGNMGKDSRMDDEPDFRGNVNDITTTGYVHCDSTATNLPTTESYHIFTLRKSKYYVCQFAIIRDDAITPRIYIRLKAGSETTYGAWSLIQTKKTYNSINNGVFWNFRDTECASFGTDGGDNENFIFIRTPLVSAQMVFNRMKITGYAYRNGSPIDLSIVWYNYTSDSIINGSYFGVPADGVCIINCTDGYTYVRLHFPWDNYFTRLTVAEFDTTYTAYTAHKNAWYIYTSSDGSPNAGSIKNFLDLSKRS